MRPTDSFHAKPGETHGNLARASAGSIPRRLALQRARPRDRHGCRPPARLVAREEREASSTLAVMNSQTAKARPSGMARRRIACANEGVGQTQPLQLIRTRGPPMAQGGLVVSLCRHPLFRSLKFTCPAASTAARYLSPNFRTRLLPRCECRAIDSRGWTCCAIPTVRKWKKLVP